MATATPTTTKYQKHPLEIKREDERKKELVAASFIIYVRAQI